MTELTRRRVRSDGRPMTPNPTVRHGHCLQCGTPIWQSTDVAEDDRWYDRRGRAGPCVATLEDHHGPA